MYNLLLLEVSHALASSSRLQFDFAALEPLLLLGIGMAAGWVWGKYCSAQGHELEHVAGRDVGSAGCSVCSGTRSVGSADRDAAASEHRTEYSGSIR